jgi:Cys-tRNA(Pro) deacylase
MQHRGERDVVEALLAAGHEPAVSRFEEGTETAEASARVLGVHQSRIIKSLVFSDGEKPVLALLPGDRRADNRAIARQLGVKKVRFASPEMVLQWTGFPVGAVPPVGHAHQMIVLMDESISRDGSIYPAAGTTSNAFETTFEKLVELTGAVVCGIAKE